MTHSNLATIAGNLRYAVFNRHTITIGGGDFGPDEISEAAKALTACAPLPDPGKDIPALIEALQTLVVRCNRLDFSATHDGLTNAAAVADARAILERITK